MYLTRFKEPPIHLRELRDLSVRLVFDSLLTGMIAGYTVSVSVSICALSGGYVLINGTLQSSLSTGCTNFALCLELFHGPSQQGCTNFVLSLVGYWVSLWLVGLWVYL